MPPSGRPKDPTSAASRRAAFKREPAPTRDAALQALGRAAALQRLAPWRWAEIPEAPPETSLPKPDAWRDLLCAAALAHSSGETEAAAALERYAGARPVDARAVPEGSLLDAARRGALDGLEAESGGVRVRLVAFRYYRLGADARSVAPHAGVLVAHRRTAEREAFLYCDFSSLRAEHAWPFDADAARAALLAAAGEEYADVDRDLGAAMLRQALDARATTFGAWLVRDLRALLGGDAPLFAFDAEDGVRCALRLVGDPVVESNGGIKATFALAVGADEREQEVPFDHLEGDDFRREAPVGEAALKAARMAADAWRGELERRARSAALAECMPHDLVTLGPSAVVRQWIDAGPPPPRPTRVAWSAQTIEGLLPGFRCDHRMEEDDEGLAVNVVDLHVGRHVLRLRIALDAWTRVELASSGAEFVVVADQDSQASPALVFAPLGDAIAFRDVCAALSALIDRASADVVLTPSGAEDGGDDEDEDDDYEGDEEEDDGDEDDGDDESAPPPPRRLTDALHFADGAEAWGLGPPAFDWRIETDFAVPESPEEIALRLGEDPAGRAAWEQACERYTAFVVETLDPSFTPPRVPW